MQTAVTLPHLALHICADEPRPSVSATVELTAPAPLTVDFHYAPGTPDVPYLRNGDPGEPGAPEELELYTATSDVPVQLAGDGLTLTIAPGVDLLPLLSAEARDDLELDVKRELDAPDPFDTLGEGIWMRKNAL